MKKHDYAKAKRSLFNLYRCRCAKCGQRRTLTSHPEVYIRPPKCGCGSKVWRIDWYRTTGIESRRTTCYCNGYHFPHRRRSRGALAGCTVYP